MADTGYRAVAIVGAGAILPDAPNVEQFWKNVTAGRYSITETPKERWDPDLYYDADRAAPDKTYSKIGGWVREYPWDPFGWKLAIPPKVADAMDGAQRWAIACTREALLDFGYPERPLPTDRTAVILGNAMAGEMHYITALRAFFPEYAGELDACSTYAALPESVRRDITREWRSRMGEKLPPITEDSMPGELANCLAGRVANVFNFRGPNFVCDAACASAMAAVRAAVEGLVEHDFDAAVTGGLDRNMGAPTFVKFCKIGALSATGSRPYAEGADGFVMGEGAGLMVLKRLEDAERDGDKIYAVIRGIGASSDGKGKGLTAPNPIGQKYCIERAWQNAGLSPATATMIEGHGTSTSVGDVVEVNSLAEALAESGANGHMIALGSVKSNIGHLKGAAGAAGILKTALALHHRTLPPSVGCERPNPNIDFAQSRLRVNTELRPWTETADGVRRAGASAFGFGGTNFHIVMEEHVPGRITNNGRKSIWISEAPPAGGTMTATEASSRTANSTSPEKAPLRGALVAGAASEAALGVRLRAVQEAALAGRTPAQGPPAAEDLQAAERIAIDYGDAAELADKCGRALKALAANQPAVWKALRAQGIYRGRGPAAKVAFLYTGQGSQYVNMLRGLRAAEPIVARTFEEADAIMAPLLGRPLSELIFVDSRDAAAMAKAEEDLRQTAVTQPAVLTVDLALTRLLEAYGIRADMTMGHSLGEYGALVAAGALPFADALDAVSARGREMTRVAVADNGKMAAVFAPVAEIERILKGVSGYAVIANLNSGQQAVIGGASAAVEEAVAAFLKAGYNAVPLPVSHAFHTSIVAPASEPLRRQLERLRLRTPSTPVVANVDGAFYPTGADARERALDILGRQIASPVQFVKGLRTLYQAGARVFVEVGPKKALHGFVEDVLGDRADVLPLFTNHPKIEDGTAFNQALCGLYAAGLGAGHSDVKVEAEPHRDAAFRASRPVVITGASLGLPGTERIFDDRNVARILKGEQFIDVIPTRHRKAMLDKHITRLVKSDNGGPVFEEIRHPGDVLKLAARGNGLDLENEFGISAERIPALDRATKLAIAAGLDALRDAGIPLVMRYKETSKGTKLPDHWMLPESLRDDTGIIFASVFPGYDSFADEQERYYSDRARREQLAILEDVRARISGPDSEPALRQELERRIAELRDAVERAPYRFDRRFLFRILSMGHSQFAELIGARGPNSQVNAACASTPHAIGIAEDWIRTGRCRRVVVVSADDVTTDHLIAWFGAGFLATGAAATEDIVEEVATPFDRRRHGMVVGMGAAAMVVESAEAAAERGLRPICEVLAAVTANSAFHGTRLDVEHIGSVMERLMRQAESRGDIRREEIAPQTVFVSHETYTPARGGSASAEIEALRRVFGKDADRVVIANTKGFTGHAMGTGIEDVVAIKSLETGVVPPVANFKEVDPELGPLNLSKGGAYPVEYALRLGAGFGSQIAMTLTRRVASGAGRPAPTALGYAYRVEDRTAWQAWLERAGGSGAELEVVRRTLRVRDTGAASLPAAVERRVERVMAAPSAPPLPPAPAREAPRATAAEPAMKAGASDAIEDRVLALVAEKTGYPREMLDRDLDLEADLGIDTVKQAEMFAAIREEYGIARDPNLKLRDFPTLARVVQFVRERRPDLQQAPAKPEAAPISRDEDPVLARILDLVAEKTGYPKDMIEPDLDLEADLGVDTVKQAEMFAAIREEYGIARDPNLKLRDFPTLARVVQFVYERRPDICGEAAPAPAAAPTVDGVAEKVLAIIAEKTGYPRDMLDPDLDLEADLGIDTVKQAEMFAEVRAAFGIARDPNLKLRDFPTLGHVIRFARERNAGPVEAAAKSEAIVEADSAPSDRVRRRVPVPTLRPALEACKETGVALAGARIVVAADRGGVAEALIEKLRWHGVEVVTPEQAADGPVHGVFWLPALDVEPEWRTMNAAEWRDAVDVRVKALYRTMRGLYEQVARRGTFLVSATRLGGYHGYEEGGATAPLGGAVTGFTKAYKHERPEALVKAVDFGGEMSAAEIAEALIGEALRDPGTVEIGYGAGMRWTVDLEERPFATEPRMKLGRDTVFVVTGAAGSIVSAITADLAAASGGTFHLLDLTPEPDRSNGDLKRFTTDRDGLKRDLFARMQASGVRVTPAMVERQLAAVERGRAAADAIEAIRRAGGEAFYHSVDLTDGDAVARVIDGIRKRHGRIDVLLHAAGLDRSHPLPDKDEREFDVVFEVKAGGLFHLLRAIGEMPVGAIVAFSSIAGRFGNAGQTDYSSANDLLCKAVSAFRRERRETRAIAIDWTAWGGMGMATRGSIPKIMEMAGIEMLPPEEGVPWIRRELEAGGAGSEVVVALSLGMLAREFDEDGGIDAAALAPMPMRDRVKVGAGGVIRIEAELDPARQPFLHDHAIEGTAVLPGVMGMEAFAEAALAGAPEWRVDAIEEMAFDAPFKFYKGAKRVVSVEAAVGFKSGSVVARCSLIGERQIANRTEPERKAHFTGRVRLSKSAREEESGDAPELIGNMVERAAIYGVYFHGPAYRVLNRAWWTPGGAVGEMAADLPANHDPASARLAAEPRLLELCFQTAGLWEIAALQRMGLPQAVGAARFYRGFESASGPLYAVVRPAGGGASFDIDVVDAAGVRYVRMEDYRTVTWREGLDAHTLEGAHAVSA